MVCAAGIALTVAFGGHAAAQTISSSGDLDLAGTDWSALSAAWWQSVLSTPTGVNPVLDSTGEHCMVGQRGPIWFLHGTFSGSATVRNCLVPADKALFFPVINNVVSNTPNLCGQAGPMNTAQLRAAVAPFIDAANHLSVAVDGQPVPMRRVRSIPFAMTPPADNVFVVPCGGPDQSPTGVFSPTVDDGYYVLLEPLSKGRHTLRILATSGGFSTDVTYNLTIAPVSLR
ncbi:MAG TPA: hypothetical protein VMG60_07420 [Burkholderiaceae bacterium]|nr:hypothetical protein [Burkholderiaceae bacterium]